MTSKKVIPFKHKAPEFQGGIPGNEAEVIETIVLETIPMPDFIEPFFTHPAATAGFMITDNDGDNALLTEEQLRELAEWVLGGMD